MVPSIHNADKLSARELEAEIRRLTAVVREGKTTPEQQPGSSGLLLMAEPGAVPADPLSTDLGLMRAHLFGRQRARRSQ